MAKLPEVFLPPTNNLTVQKSSIIDEILNWATRKADKELKKTDGKGRNR